MLLEKNLNRKKRKQWKTIGIAHTNKQQQHERATRGRRWKLTRCNNFTSYQTHTHTHARTSKTQAQLLLTVCTKGGPEPSGARPGGGDAGFQSPHLANSFGDTE